MHQPRQAALNSTTKQTGVNTVSKNKFSRRNLTGDMAKLIIE
jgi:hypothetical protein